MCMLNTVWHYVPDLHDFEYTAEIEWPTGDTRQLDWIQGVSTVEAWLIKYTGAKYQRWAWNTATDYYQLSVAFKYDKHRMLFLLAYN